MKVFRFLIRFLVGKRPLGRNSELRFAIFLRLNYNFEIKFFKIKGSFNNCGKNAKYRRKFDGWFKRSSKLTSFVWRKEKYFIGNKKVGKNFTQQK